VGVAARNLYRTAEQSFLVTAARHTRVLASCFTTWTPASTHRALADNRLRGYIRLKEQELNNWLRQMEQMGVKITPEAFEHHMLQLEQEVG